MWRRTANEILCCPTCHSDLRIETTEQETSEWIEAGVLLCENCRCTYPISSGIVRFVGDKTYADNFGLQWNIFRTTQLDSCSGLPISKNRFDHFTNFGARNMMGKLTLDVGCGTGRFTEIALSYGARVVALDYSRAVDACRSNLGIRQNLDFVQADINTPPFQECKFEFVYCLGVIQHTPEPDKTFQSLTNLVKPAGRLAIDVYAKLRRNILFSKYWIRPITRRLSPNAAYRLAQSVFKVLYPASIFISRIPFAGHYLKYLLPVANYHGTYPLSAVQHREWALLDTLDMWCPAFDTPQDMATVQKWFRDARFVEVEVFRCGFNVGRGTKTKPGGPVGIKM